MFYARRFVVAARAFALTVLSVGCGGLSARVTRETSLHTYQTGCERVLPTVQEALVARGYDPQARADGSPELVTAWRRPETADKSRTIPLRYRYTARVRYVGATTCQLRVERESDDRLSPTRERDVEVEWEVLRRVAPVDAQRIEGGG